MALQNQYFWQEHFKSGNFLYKSRELLSRLFLLKIDDNLVENSNEHREYSS